MKKITIKNLAAIKRTAQNVNPLVTRKNKCKEMIAELASEILELDEEIKGYEGGIMALTGGYTSEQLVEKRVTDTGKLNKDNKPVKKTEYLPTSVLKYDSENNCYWIEEESDKVVAETETNEPKDVEYTEL